MNKLKQFLNYANTDSFASVQIELTWNDKPHKATFGKRFHWWLALVVVVLILV